MTIRLDEHILPLREACRYFPDSNRSKSVHVSRLYRYTREGLRGVRLESIQCGGTRCTSREAIGRFFEALTAKTDRSNPNLEDPQ